MMRLLEGFLILVFEDEDEAETIFTRTFASMVFLIMVLEFLVHQSLMSLPVLSMIMTFMCVKFVTKRVTSLQTVFKGILPLHLPLPGFNVKFAESLAILLFNAFIGLIFLIKGDHHHQLLQPCIPLISLLDLRSLFG
ncbi:hypothetical protein ACFX1T_009540 [Malus domestica]